MRVSLAQPGEASPLQCGLKMHRVNPPAAARQAFFDCLLEMDDEPRWSAPLLAWAPSGGQPRHGRRAFSLQSDRSFDPGGYAAHSNRRVRSTPWSRPW